MDSRMRLFLGALGLAAAADRPPLRAVFHLLGRGPGQAWLPSL